MEKVKLWRNSFINSTEGKNEFFSTRPKFFIPEKRICNTKERRGILDSQPVSAYCRIEKLNLKSLGSRVRACSLNWQSSPVCFMLIVRRFRKATQSDYSFVMPDRLLSLRSHGTTLLPLDRFP